MFLQIYDEPILLCMKGEDSAVEDVPQHTPGLKNALAVLSHSVPLCRLTHRLQKQILCVQI